MSKEVGISIRMVREYDLEADTWPPARPTMFDLALMLAVGDERDLPFADKLADALTYLRRQVQ